MDEFIAQGHLPTFKKLRDSSSAFITEALERAPHLEPWILWINVHTGVNFDEHGAEHLGEGHKVKQPAVWDLISDAGMKVWVCGSMNVHCSPDINGNVLPDPWSSDTVVKPEAMRTYYDFVKKQVQEHSNADAKFGKLDYLKFLGFMGSHGLKGSTVSAAINQIKNERSEGKRWRRAFILDLLQFDVFEHVYKKERPMFSTFFLNSTAHMQHVYWRNMQPELFQIKPTEKEQKEYASAILEGYVHMDKLLARLMQTVADDATIIFSTALSQQPFLRYEDKGGKRIYRPRKIPAFVNWAGVENLKAANPVMAEQFWLEFGNEAEALAAEKVLTGVTLNGEPALLVQRDGAAIFAGFQIRSQVAKDAVLQSGTASAPFSELFYEIEGLKSGMHHPDGLLWIRSPKMPKHQAHERVPLESIAPTVLDLLEVPVPATMKAASLMQAEVPQSVSA